MARFPGLGVQESNLLDHPERALRYAAMAASV